MWKLKIKKLTKVRLVVLKTLEKLDLSVFTLWSPYGSGKATIKSINLQVVTTAN